MTETTSTTKPLNVVDFPLTTSEYEATFNSFIEEKVKNIDAKFRPNKSKLPGKLRYRKSLQIMEVEKRRVITEMMPEGWLPSILDTDLTKIFTKADGSCSLSDVIKKAQTGYLNSPPEFYLKSTRQNIYAKIIIFGKHTNYGLMEGYSGYLTHCAELLAHFRTRFFVIGAKSLDYYISETQADKKGSIPLESIININISSPKGRMQNQNMFYINTPTRKYMFQAATSIDAKKNGSDLLKKLYLIKNGVYIALYVVQKNIKAQYAMVYLYPYLNMITLK